MSIVTSRYIDIQGMNNTRDLGGMRTKDGHVIRSNMLYRSSNLNDLKDPDWFMQNIGLVVDMRSTKETIEKPDPRIPGVEYLHLPIFEDRGAAGVTRDKKSERRLGGSDPVAAMERMADIYRRFISDDFSLSQYRRFIKLLYEPREKAVLWHCTAGKDRTGVGALFILEILGVRSEDIIADYLITNDYLRDEVDHILDIFRERYGGMDEISRQSMLAVLSAREKYILTVYAEVEARYGTFDSFIRDGLGVSDHDRIQLQHKYLELSNS